MSPQQVTVLERQHKFFDFTMTLLTEPGMAGLTCKNTDIHSSYGLRTALERAMIRAGVAPRPLAQWLIAEAQPCVWRLHKKYRLQNRDST